MEQPGDSCVCTLPNIAKPVQIYPDRTNFFLALQAMSGDQASLKLNIQLLLIIFDNSLGDSLMGAKTGMDGWNYQIRKDM